MDSHGIAPVGALSDAHFRQAVKNALSAGLGCKSTLVVDVISDPN